MPYNDYICAKCGKHFRDIDEWRAFCNPKNCGDKALSEDRNKIREEIIETLPPPKRVSGWAMAVAIAIMCLLLGGVVYGVIMLIKWITGG
jgi:DNA-directed RNA polymerase subunit RPC12/RpoP